MSSALAAYAPTYICGIRAVLEVLPTGCRQGGIQLLGHNANFEAQKFTKT